MSPGTVQVKAVVVQILPPGVEVARYNVTGAPWVADTCQDTIAFALPIAADGLCGR